MRLDSAPRIVMGSERLHLLLDISDCQVRSCHIFLLWEFLCQQSASVYV